MSTVEQLVEKTVEALGYELVDFEMSNRGGMLRVFIDKLPQRRVGTAGETQIAVEDCEIVTRQLQRVFEVEGIDYGRLEVSSPGLDRRLRKAADFARFAGQTAEVRLRLPINGRKKFVGVLRDATGETVELDCEGGPFRLVLADIDRARLVPKL